MGILWGLGEERGEAREAEGRLGLLEELIMELLATTGRRVLVDKALLARAQVAGAGVVPLAAAEEEERLVVIADLAEEAVALVAEVLAVDMEQRLVQLLEAREVREVLDQEATVALVEQLVPADQQDQQLRQMGPQVYQQYFLAEEEAGGLVVVEAEVGVEGQTAPEEQGLMVVRAVPAALGAESYLLRLKHFLIAGQFAQTDRREPRRALLQTVVIQLMAQMMMGVAEVVVVPVLEAEVALEALFS